MKNALLMKIELVLHNKVLNWMSVQQFSDQIDSFIISFLLDLLTICSYIYIPINIVYLGS